MNAFQSTKFGAEGLSYDKFGSSEIAILMATCYKQSQSLLPEFDIKMKNVGNVNDTALQLLDKIVNFQI